jgi:HEAT repeat protein
MDVVRLYMTLLAVGGLLLAAFALTLVIKRLQRNIVERRRTRRAVLTRAAVDAGGSAALAGLAADARGGRRLIELGAEIDRLWPLLSEGERAELAAALDRSGLVGHLLGRTRSWLLVRRMCAAQFLGQARVERAVGPLRRLLLRGALAERVVAARGLRRIGTVAAADGLLAGARAGALPAARLAELFADGWANARIVAALADEPLDAPDRATLLMAAGLGGAVEAGDEVYESFESRSSEVRIAAARAAGRLAPAGGMAPLCRALSDDDWRVAAQAARSLGTLGDPAAVFALETAARHDAWWVRANAADALAGLGEPGRQALERLAAGQDRYAAERAREALGLEESAAA